MTKNDLIFNNLDFEMKLLAQIPSISSQFNPTMDINPPNQHDIDMFDDDLDDNLLYFLSPPKKARAAIFGGVVLGIAIFLTRNRP